jgi:hypothetical protein
MARSATSLGTEGGVRPMKPRLVPSNPPLRAESADVRSPADFSDPESERVLDAVADALIGPLALQAAREDWLASQRGRP